jgi:catechol 2,3-dioxygenase-like lactoylglutathione lyase family enzyme
MRRRIVQLGRLDHVNLRTAKVETMRNWYVEVLGMRDGVRPDFPFPGAWLYAGDHPFVHLVGVEREPKTAEPKIEHFAFSATGLAEFTAALDAKAIPYQTARVPSIGILQVNVFDPDGNHIHIDFPKEEADRLGL